MLYCVNLLNIKEKALKETSFAGSTLIDRNGLSPTESRPVVCVQGEEHSRAHDWKSICFRRISRLPEDCAWRALSVKVGEQRRFSTRVVPREMRSFLLLKAGYGFLVPEFMSVADIGSGTFFVISENVFPYDKPSGKVQAFAHAFAMVAAAYAARKGI